MTRAACLKTATGERIVLVGGLRTPFARQASDYLGLCAVELGRYLVDELIWRLGIEPAWVDQLVFGQVIPIPSAPNIAREIVLGSRLDAMTDAFSVTRSCLTGFQSIACAVESMLSGRHRVVIAGGADSASASPFGLTRHLAQILMQLGKTRSPGQRWRLLRQLRFADLKPVAPALREYSTGLSMGQLAEQTARNHGIGRAEQDAFALSSHQKAAAAWTQGLVDACVVPILDGGHRDPLIKDNGIRFAATPGEFERAGTLVDPGFGTVTPASLSAWADGAAALLLMTESRARELGYPPLAYLRSYAFRSARLEVGQVNATVQAVAAALMQAGCSLTDIQLLDMHEASAAQALATLNSFEGVRCCDLAGACMSLGEVDRERLNVLGGSLAYGHPAAATGVRMLLQNVRELARRGGGPGLIFSSASGGLGGAMVWETEV